MYENRPLIHVFARVFLNLSVMSFPKLVNMAKTTPFFPILHVFAPLNDVRAYIALSWKTTLIAWIFLRGWYPTWNISGPPPPGSPGLFPYALLQWYVCDYFLHLEINHDATWLLNCKFSFCFQHKDVPLLSTYISAKNANWSWEFGALFFEVDTIESPRVIYKSLIHNHKFSYSLCNSNVMASSGDKAVIICCQSFTRKLRSKMQCPPTLWLTIHFHVLAICSNAWKVSINSLNLKTSAIWYDQ